MPKRPKPGPLLGVPPEPQQPTTVTARRVTPAQQLLQHPSPEPDPRLPHDPRHVLSKDAGRDRNLMPGDPLDHHPPEPSHSSESSDSTPTSALVSSPSSDSERGSSVLCTPTEDVGRAATSPVPPPSASRPTPPYFGSFRGICMCFRRPSTGQEQARALPSRGTRTCCKMLVRAALRCPCHFQLQHLCPLRSQSATRPSSPSQGPVSFAS